MGHTLDGRRDLWGNDPPAGRRCWGRSETCAVGSFPAGASPSGALDMAGNVRDWTSSEDNGFYRIACGDSWSYAHEVRARAAVRDRLTPP